MYFDAVVVEFKKDLFFIQIGSGHTVGCKVPCNFQKEVVSLLRKNSPLEYFLNLVSLFW